MTMSLIDAAAAREAAARRANRRRTMVIRLTSVAVLLLAWEIGGLYMPRIFLAPFHETVAAFVRLGRDGNLVMATLNSVAVLLAGLLISVVFRRHSRLGDGGATAGSIGCSRPTSTASTPRLLLRCCRSCRSG